MRISTTQSLFPWDALEDSPALKTLRRFLDAIPDGKLLDGLRRARGKGRNDHPVSSLWGVLLLTIVLRHATFEGCLDELRRHHDLRGLIGIEEESRVPDQWNVSRFLETLGQEPHLSNLRAVFDFLVQRLGRAVADLGTHSAGDATSLNGRAKKNAQQIDSETEQGLPQPSGGRKEYQDDGGRVTKVVEWFGYKLHLLVDVRHEVALAYAITPPAVGDTEMIRPLLDHRRGPLPERRIESLADDKAADDEKVHQAPDAAGIKPLIENRAPGKTEPEPMLPGHTGRSNVVHDEAGTISGDDEVSEPMVRHRMASAGH
jgi:Transposase DDE domain/Transposase domain (DUF772)